MLPLLCYTQDLNNAFRRVFDIDQIESTFNTVQGIANLFHKSTKLGRLLKENCGGKVMVSDCNTRFSSKFFVIERVIEKKRAILHCFLKSELSLIDRRDGKYQATLDINDLLVWDKIDGLYNLLLPLFNLFKFSKRPYYRLSDSFVDFAKASKSMVKEVMKDSMLELYVGMELFERINHTYLRFINNGLSLLALFFDLRYPFQYSDEALSVAIDALKKICDQRMGEGGTEQIVLHFETFVAHIRPRLVNVNAEDPILVYLTAIDSGFFFKWGNLSFLKTPFDALVDEVDFGRGTEEDAANLNKELNFGESAEQRFGNSLERVAEAALEIHDDDIGGTLPITSFDTPETKSLMEAIGFLFASEEAF
ncbi:unnamed protein product [Ambrosiozyma monospora]|uniref:Unnamed protein product n=1 Tax=Ambrosiozyma monospora TaxID=43982 RepID=A0ACB5SRK4_AMBMO|nr:unnamed protein product [Ambrosiozyma monospora]